jgi:hypothetical protein
MKVHFDCIDDDNFRDRDLSSTGQIMMNRDGYVRERKKIQS